MGFIRLNSSPLSEGYVKVLYHGSGYYVYEFTATGEDPFHIVYINYRCNGVLVHDWQNKVEVLDNLCFFYDVLPETKSHEFVVKSTSIDVLGEVEPSTGMITQPYYDLHKGIAIYGLYSGDDRIYIGYIEGIGAKIIEDPDAFLQIIDYLTIPNLYGKPRKKVITFGDLWETSEDRWEFVPEGRGMNVFLNGLYQGTYTREGIQTWIYKKYKVFEML